LRGNDDAAMIKIRTLDQLHVPPGARVFYRVDYNVPLVESPSGNRIADATRIEETLPTLRILRERGAAVILASHLGRPKGARNDQYSLKPIREKLADLLGQDVQWADDCVGIDTSQLKTGELLLLENLRFHAGEEKNDPAFAAELRKLADYYINDAFGACHRAHASIDALPRLMPHGNIAGGLLLERELTFLQKVTNIEERPFVALMGGAKIAGKIEPLEALIQVADKVLIGGGMANTFLAARGVPMGGSLVDKDSLDVAQRIMETHARAELMLPTDLIVADSLDQPTEIEDVEVTEGLTADAKAFDIGPATVQRYEAELKEAKLIFWNGPMGVFEKEPFAQGTMAMARAVAAADAITVVGGGESVEAIKASGFADRITHISTGGGASLEFISGASLPGVEVLRIPS
jgi:phosphoglycerate kinase